jgi:hypothetical protein
VGQAVLVEDDGGVALRLEFAEGVARGVALGAEFLELRVGVRRAERLHEPLGVAVEGLAGEALVVGAAGDVAPRPFEDGGGVGDAALGG